MHPGNVLLLSMPWHALERPSLGLSLLQAEVRALDVRCDIAYLGFSLSDFIGLEDYLWVHSGLPYTAFAGDWLFTRSLYGDRAEADSRYVHEVLVKTWNLSEGDVRRLLRVRSYIEPFLDHCMQAHDFGSYSIVGFTSTFEQNIASLALAQRIKSHHPDVTIAFGGANWEGEMGFALHQRFAFVDVVCSGEADTSFPGVVECVGSKRALDDVPGVVFRHGEQSISTGPAPVIKDLDSLPIVDFDDYFESRSSCASAAEVAPLLLLETSRGCWWGAKHHCTFCGLNGGTMAFRSKSAERVIEELTSLVERYDVQNISVVDNIFDMRYFKTLLPRIIESDLPPLSLFYEVKANLTHEQIRLLGAAGVRHVQPGIESLSDHVLNLMDKGTSWLQNVQMLKWCKEYGIKPEWNLLYGFPGEEPADYDHMLPIIDAIDFLDPPSGHGPIRLDRFSPYHADPGRHGMLNVRAMRPYDTLYPFDEHTLMKIAYYFEFDYHDNRDPLSYAGPLIERIRAWNRSGPVGSLWMIPLGGARLVIVDRRAGQHLVTLESWRAEVYMACDRISSFSGLSRIAGDVEPGELEAWLDDCVRRRIMVNDGQRYLALAVHRPPRASVARSGKRVSLQVAHAS